MLVFGKVAWFIPTSRNITASRLLYGMTNCQFLESLLWSRCRYFWWWNVTFMSHA